MPVPEGISRLNPPQRILLGPDLSNPSPRAVQGLIASLEGANDPDFRRVLQEVADLAKHLFQTDTGEILLLPGSEEAGPEAVLSSLLAPGDRVLVASHGFYSERLTNLCRRLSLQTSVVEAQWGFHVPPDQITDAIKTVHPRAVLMVQGEGSTGVEQPLDGVSTACQEQHALLLLDATFTLGGVEIAFDRWGLDACWGGSNKCLSALPGVVLLALSAHAVHQLESRTGNPATRYFDLRLVRSRTAYDTLPAPLIYALDEVLQLAATQSLAYRFRRHINRRDALVAALEVMGLELFAEPGHRLPSVTTVRVPAGVDGDALRAALLRQFRIEIGGGLGALQGQLWRVALMAHSATPAHIVLFLACLEQLLKEARIAVPQGEGVRAALSVLEP